MARRFRYLSSHVSWSGTSIWWSTRQRGTASAYSLFIRCSAIVSAEKQEDADDGIDPRRGTGVRAEPRRGPIPARLRCYTGEIYPSNMLQLLLITQIFLQERNVTLVR